MDQGLIPRRYAKALYMVAAENKTDSLMYSRLNTLAEAFAAEPQLGKTMANPFISAADKSALLFTAAHTSAVDAPELVRFFALLEENGRMAMVRDIALAYLGIYRREHRIFKVDVVSAAPMQPQTRERLESLIAAQIPDGTMEYSFSVDPGLLGGFTVSIDNQRLDASVKNELKQLRLKLLSNK